MKRCPSCNKLLHTVPQLARLAHGFTLCIDCAFNIDDLETIANFDEDGIILQTAKIRLTSLIHTNPTYRPIKPPPPPQKIDPSPENLS